MFGGYLHNPQRPRPAALATGLSLVEVKIDDVTQEVVLFYTHDLLRYEQVYSMSIDEYTSRFGIGVRES